MAARKVRPGGGGRLLAVTAPLLALLLGIPSPAAAVAFCVLHPLNPLCCPSPCPVIDLGKLADLAEEVGQAVQVAERCRAMVRSYADLVLSFGPNGPLGQELRRVPGNVSKLAASFSAATPGLTRPGALAEPRALAETLKQALFDPDGLATAQLTTRLDKVRRRAELAAEQTADALRGC